MEKPLPLLDQIDVASPCHARWEEMSGDDRARFCSHCRLHVYNLSDMTPGEAEAFVRERESEPRTCIRFHRRQDGTTLTRDCPVGLRAVRQRFTRAVAAMAGVLMALVTGTLFGGLFNRLKPDGLRPPAQSFADWINPQPPTWEYVTGKMIYHCPTDTRPALIPAEPAETPLLAPTPEQLEEIQQRLEP
jgi:hypothetical protein